MSRKTLIIRLNPRAHLEIASGSTTLIQVPGHVNVKKNLLLDLLLCIVNPSLDQFLLNLCLRPTWALITFLSTFVLDAGVPAPASCTLSSA